MKYQLASSSWDEKEVNAGIDVLKSGFCTMGQKVRDFEEKFAKQFGTKYAVMSNSGSSANLLAIAALMYRKNGKKLYLGDEVIVPAVSWATTYYPLHQYGLKIKFVDIDLETLNINMDSLESAITDKTKAIFAVNLLGNPCDFNRLVKICNDRDIILLEDNCESMGATFNGKECGTFGVMGTFSGFFSHHISMVEAGVTVTNDEELYHILISLRSHGWTRGLPDINFVHNKDGNVFNDLFRFVLPGYNIRPNDIFAAIGIEQLDKLPSLVKKRRDNASYFLERMNDTSKTRNNIKTQFSHNKSSSSWFGFSLVLVGEFKNRREDLVKLLTESDIECRPIVAGNFTKNPVISHMNCEIHDKLSNSDYIDTNGLFVGNNGVDLTKEIDFLVSTLNNF